MKKQFLTLIKLIILFLVFSCSTETNSNVSEIPEINNLNLDIPINFDNLEGVYFKTSNLNSFTNKFSEDFFGDISFNILISNEYTTIKFIEENDDLVGTHSNSNQINSKSSITFKTCREPLCVQDVIKEGFDKYDAKSQPVYFATKPVKALGVTTGVKVCYAPVPIDVTKIYVQPIRIEEEDKIPPKERTITSIDHLLE